MTLPGEDLAGWQARSSKWLTDFAKHPFGLEFLASWFAGKVVSVIAPGWIVLELLGPGDTGWWVHGWALWRPVIEAHVLTGLAIGLAFYVHTIADRARTFIDGWTRDDAPDPHR